MKYCQSMINLCCYVRIHTIFLKENVVCDSNGPSIKYVTLGGWGWGFVGGGGRGQRYEALHGGGGVSGRSLRNANLKFYLSCFLALSLVH